ncbi:MAG TPA: hypothetical protein VGI95_01160 [Caulobacteraceae bacterium]|jgi:hypothetical protein
MIDDPAHLDRQSAYLEQIRQLGRPQRFAGFIACLVGVVVLVVARFRLGSTPWVLWPGAAIVAVGWGLFIYAVARRLLWIRAHPFDSNAQDRDG